MNKIKLLFAVVFAFASFTFCMPGVDEHYTREIKHELMQEGKKLLEMIEFYSFSVGDQLEDLKNLMSTDGPFANTRFLKILKKYNETYEDRECRELETKIWDAYNRRKDNHNAEPLRRSEEIKTFMRMTEKNSDFLSKKWFSFLKLVERRLKTAIQAASEYQKICFEHSAYAKWKDSKKTSSQSVTQNEKAAPKPQLKPIPVQIHIPEPEPDPIPESMRIPVLAHIIYAEQFSQAMPPHRIAYVSRNSVPQESAERPAYCITNPAKIYFIYSDHQDPEIQMDMRRSLMNLDRAAYIILDSEGVTQCEYGFPIVKPYDFKEQ